MMWECKKCKYLMHGDECEYKIITDLDTLVEIKEGNGSLLYNEPDIWICPRCHFCQADEKNKYFFERLNKRMEGFNKVLKRFSEHMKSKKIKFKINRGK